MTLPTVVKRVRTLSVLLALPLLAACGAEAPTGAQPSLGPAAFEDPPSTTSPQSPEPRTVEAVRKVAKEEFGTYANGDYGAAWDLWTAEAQRTIPRSTYRQLHRLCRPPAAAAHFRIIKVRVVGNAAAVRVTRANTNLIVRFAYRQGRWRFIPPQSTLREHHQIRLHGLHNFVAAQKQKGRCGGAAPTTPARTP
jgi:hypothetical protein